MKTKPLPRPAPTTRNGLAALHGRVLKKVAGMSTRQRFDYMVAAGIYTKSGKLTRHYGG